MRLDERWSMDFVPDQLANGRYFRVLAVIDQCSRECVALHAGLSIRSKRVGELLDEAIRQRGAPAAITCDNGLEFTSR
jgi:putative transposase